MKPEMMGALTWVTPRAKATMIRGRPRRPSGGLSICEVTHFGKIPAWVPRASSSRLQPKKGPPEAVRIVLPAAHLPAARPGGVPVPGAGPGVRKAGGHVHPSQGSPVPFRLCQIAGPMPMANSFTFTPSSLAVMKCPNSWMAQRGQRGGGGAVFGGQNWISGHPPAGGSRPGPGRREGQSGPGSNS